LATVLRGEWARTNVSSLISCVGGGVFLVTCLLDLLPEALESYEKVGVRSKFPVVEAAVAGGLLMVLTIEQVVIIMQERGWLISGRVHEHNEEERNPLSLSSPPVADESSNHVIGVSLLVLALSLHALFEGLSLAVINDSSKLLEVFAALILHKCIIGFSLGVRLVQSGLRTPCVALCSCLFSIQILIGGLGGIEIMSVLSGGDRTTAAMASSVLQGIACGTFLYITTFEILPYELERTGSRIAKLACLFLGVLIMLAFLIFLPDAD
ncbi:metal cation transporter, ZIP family, partial [Necator americanus]